ncbi:hypothetical protein H8F24_09330 [Synechococcus sp. CBW1002]|uniref:hypothetical protein n=1 Tax=Synechococcus sp. CBW1002 TaxID=1353134 RepID=UPI0018CEEA9C|nr:hypothetical protein [Synechococcus sp. CBW1002]QPN58449.1 hypothetical protein H8F24_09330 [Synechococcus sp. CBW1002]
MPVENWLVGWFFSKLLSRSKAAAIALLGNAFGGNRSAEDCVYVVSDRFSAYNHLPLGSSASCAGRT